MHLLLCQRRLDTFLSRLSGARGIVRDIWSKTIVYNLDQVDSTVNVNTSGYIHESYTDFAASPTVETFQKVSRSFTARLRGYFEPPSSDCYRFFVRSDDSSALFFSNTSSPRYKVRVYRIPVIY